MTTINLYTGGGVSLSPLNGEGRYLSNYVRLVAGEGKAVTNGNVISQCIDVLATDVSNWTEIDEPGEELTPEETLSVILGGEQDV